MSLIEAQLHHEIHAGEQSPHIHGVGLEFYHPEDGKPLPIVGGRKYKIEVLTILRDRLRGNHDTR